MTNYNENKPGFREVRDAYDAMISARTARRREAMIRVERECAAQDKAEQEALAQMMHDYYRGGTTKTVLRNATRQYGSPKFTELWEAVPFEGERPKATTGVPVVQKPKGYTRDDDTVTFNRENWDWTGISEDVLALEYEVAYSEDYEKFLLFESTPTPAGAMFSMKNSAELTKLVNETEDFNE